MDVSKFQATAVGRTYAILLVKVIQVYDSSLWSAPEDLPQPRQTDTTGGNYDPQGWESTPRICKRPGVHVPTLKYYLSV